MIIETSNDAINFTLANTKQFHVSIRHPVFKMNYQQNDMTAKINKIKAVL